ncbi:MAG: hypothetical protein ACI9CD_000879 [Candidatus Deianiraeaceae bacterium]|jgi:hypothetical protein
MMLQIFLTQYQQNFKSKEIIQQQKESAIEKISRQVDSAGFKFITKEGYGRLTQKDNYLLAWIKSPAFLTTLLIGIITYGWTLIDYGVSKYIKEKVQEVNKEQLPIYG